MREFGNFVAGRMNHIPKNIMAKLSDSKLLSEIVKWMDNNPVYTISTYAGVLPEDEVSHYNRSKIRITTTR